MNIYTEFPPSQIAAEKEYLTAAIFKCLPYREESYPYLDNYFESLLQRLIGFNKVFGQQPELISIVSLIAYARNTDDDAKYRKAILDACSMVKLIKESDAHD